MAQLIKVRYNTNKLAKQSKRIHKACVGDVKNVILLVYFRSCPHCVSFMKNDKELSVWRESRREILNADNNIVVQISFNKVNDILNELETLECNNANFKELIHVLKNINHVPLLVKINNGKKEECADTNSAESVISFAN